MKKFICLPGAILLSILFAISALPWIIFAVSPGIPWVNSSGEPDRLGGVIVCIIMFVLALAISLFCLIYGKWRMEVYDNQVICKGLFSKDTFGMKYSDCNIGFDYHVQNGQKIWWIYICQGPLYQYKKGSAKKTINSIRIRPGFIRIMYSDEVCAALAEVLPQKQRNGLEIARRSIGLDK